MGDCMIHDKSGEIKLGHTAQVYRNYQFFVFFNNLCIFFIVLFFRFFLLFSVYLSCNSTQVNAHLVVDNIKRLELGSKPLTYPEAVTGGGPTPKIYCISLGKYDASLGFSWLVVNGKLAGFMKWLLEWTQVQAADEKPIGTVFWKVATTCLCLSLLSALFCLLFTACCLLPAVCCLLPAVCCLLPAVCCLLSAVCCLLSAVYSLLPAACCLLPAACCLLPAACFLLPAVYCLLPAVCCLLSAV
jgi:hypothetical protein